MHKKENLRLVDKFGEPIGKVIVCGTEPEVRNGTSIPSSMFMADPMDLRSKPDGWDVHHLENAGIEIPVYTGTLDNKLPPTFKEIEDGTKCF